MASVYDYTDYKCDYRDLLINELLAITAYMERNDPNATANIIKNSENITNGMKSFIADVFTGKRRRPTGKKVSTERRDFEIGLFIDDLMDDDPSLSLTISRKDGAATIAAEEFGESESVAEKAHLKFKKLMGLQ